MKHNLKDGGYFTLEAALILPFALGAVLLVFRIWFYRYDRVLQDMDTSAVVVRAMEQQDMSAEEKASYVVSQMQGRYKDHYMSWEFGDISVSCSNDSVSCTVTGSLGGSGTYGLLYEPESFNASVTRSRNALSEVFVIRTYRKALGFGKSVSESLGEE